MKNVSFLLLSLAHSVACSDAIRSIDRMDGKHLLIFLKCNAVKSIYRQLHRSMLWFRLIDFSQISRCTFGFVFQIVSICLVAYSSIQKSFDRVFFFCFFVSTIQNGNVEHGLDHEYYYYRQDMFYHMFASCDNNSVWKWEKKRCKYPISFESHSRCDLN